MEMWLVSKPNVSNSTLQLSLNGSVFRGGRTVTCSSEGRLARLEKDGSQDGKNEGYNLDISLVPRNQQVQPYATHLSASVTLSWEAEECSAYGQMTGKGWFASIPAAHTPLPSPQILPQSAVPAAE